MQMLPVPQEPSRGRSNGGRSQQSRRSRSRRAGPRPGPDGAGPDDRPERGRAATRERLLDELRTLSGLVTMGILPPARANLIQRGIKLQLDEIHRREAAPAAGPETEQLVEACIENPDLLDLVEPMLTDSQYDFVFRSVSGGAYPNAEADDEADEEGDDEEPEIGDGDGEEADA